jgi:hypothetical protein
MARLHEAVAARDAFAARYGTMPWVREIGIWPADTPGGFCVQVNLGEPVRGLPLQVHGVAVHYEVRPPLPPLAVPRWAWSGYPALFELLDTNGDGLVDTGELDEGLGVDALRLVRGDISGQIHRETWRGSPKLFEHVDLDRDGHVDQNELREALGPQAVRLVQRQPALGPGLPPGAAYGWKGAARWITFKDREDKARYMADAARHDANDPVIRWWAQAFRSLPRPERERAILRFCQRCFRYERDPAWFDEDGTRHGIELLDSSAVGFLRGYGDCDLKARVFVALCLACDVPADIEPVFRGENGFPHVRARVLHPAGSRWETADPTVVNSTIGHLPQRPLTALPPEGLAAFD